MNLAGRLLVDACFSHTFNLSYMLIMLIFLLASLNLCTVCIVYKVKDRR